MCGWGDMQLPDRAGEKVALSIICHFPPPHGKLIQIDDKQKAAAFSAFHIWKMSQQLKKVHSNMDLLKTEQQRKCCITWLQAEELQHE